MRKLFFAALALTMAVSLSGCSLTDKLMNKAGEKIGEKIVEKATNSEVDVTNNQVTVNTNEGSTTWGENLSLPDDFPTDVPIYSGANIATSTTDTSSNAFYITMISSDDFKTISDYYKAEIENQGWTTENASSYNSESGKSTTYIATKDNRDLTVGLYETTGETATDVSITISVSETISE